MSSTEDMKLGMKGGSGSDSGCDSGLAGDAVETAAVPIPSISPSLPSSVSYRPTSPVSVSPSAVAKAY